MQPWRPERVRSERRSRRPAARLGIAVGVSAAITLGLLPGVGHAEPEPSVGELTTQAKRLGDQMEQLTEQYNGLKVRLQQSERAAAVATSNARRQEQALAGIRDRVGGIAATSYMNGGTDQTVTFITSQDPQALLDRAATLNYFARQDGTQVQNLLRAMQAAQRARQAAQDRAGQVRSLRTEALRRRKKVADLYERVRGKLVKRDPGSMARLPVVGGGKAAQALRFAMSKMGRPYVWGAAGPSTFDCSGLTMWAYRKVGINLPHYTGSQFNAGTRISRDQLQPGDLVFFYTDLHHMGIYIGKGQMLHAPQTGDVVKISPMKGRPFAGGVRVA